MRIFDLTMAARRCPCELTREELDAHHLVGPGGVCTALWADGSGIICGEPLGAHPREGRILSIISPESFVCSFISFSFVPITFDNLLNYFH